MKKAAIVHWILPSLLFLGLYFITRLIAIRTLPPFNDEFIYVRWAQEGFFDAGKRLLSLTDGKQPLFIWLTSLMMNVIPSPLAAGRIVSIFAGAATMVGVGVLSYQLFKNRLISYTSALLYILFPFALLLDRFALYDSLLGAIFVWTLVVGHRLAAVPTLGTGLVLALLLGAALLTKSSALLFMIIVPLELLLVNAKRTIPWRALGYFVIAACLAFVYQAVQYVSPDVGFIAEKNTVFIYTWQELRTQIGAVVSSNLPLFGSWIAWYIPLPLLILSVLTVWKDRKNLRVYGLLLFAFSIPFGVAVATGKIVYPRHLFFATLPLLILGAAALVNARSVMRQRWARVLLLFLCVAPSVYLSGRILADFKTALLPAADRFQYVEGWPAGWGVKEIVRYLEGEAQKGKITVVTEGWFGSLPTTVMQLYFGNYPQVHIQPVDDTTFEIPLSVDRGYPVYAILNKTQEIPSNWGAEEVLKIQKGNGDSYIRLVKVISGR